MKASKSLLIQSYKVPENHFFATRTDRDTFFITNVRETGDLCAISSTGSMEQDVNAQVWDLEVFNGANWVLQTIDDNYSLVITNEGLRALTYVNENAGGYRVNITGIKIKSSNITDTTTTPLTSWTDREFCAAGDVILDSDQAGSANPSFSIDKNLSWKMNMANGGIQYCVLIDNSTVGFQNNTKLYDYTVGAVGLYVNDPESQSNKVLFAIANLNTNIRKYATTVRRLGNSIKLYLNTVLSNLGYVSDVKVLPEDVGSIPEVGTELELQEYYPNPETAPYNLYLVNNLYSSNIPALAVRTGNPIDSNVGWTFFSPNDDVITINETQYDSSKLTDYMVAAWDKDTQKYIPASGEANQDTQVVGIKIGNSLIFAGSIKQKLNTYSYKHILTSSGQQYEPGEKLKYTAKSTDGKKQVTFTINIMNSGANGQVNENNYYITPSIGDVELSDNVVIQPEEITYFDSKKPGSGSGFGVKRMVTSNYVSGYEWNFANDEINKPIYVGIGNDAGKIVTYETELFLGWCTGNNSIKLALDLRNEASYTELGVTRYATADETINVTKNDGTKNLTSVVPENLQKYYLLTKRNKDSNNNYQNIGNPGETPNTAIEVETHVKFKETIVGKGVPDFSSNIPYNDNVSFFGLAYRAWWGDLAEFYEADEIYEPGTLVTIGAGSAEITRAKIECNGIISTAPGYELGEKKSAFDLPVALVGKVPVIISKDCIPEFGDRIYLSKTEPGHASTIINGRCLGKIIDRDENLKNKKTVMCSVKISF